MTEKPERDPLECLDCGHRWDDLDPEAEVCDCFDRLGRRRSMQIPESELNWPSAKDR